MAEDEEDEEEGVPNGALISGLEKGDLKPNFYEGGFKTWECATDLARYLLIHDEEEHVLQGEDDDELHIIEVSGHTLYLFLFFFFFFFPETWPDLKPS